MRGEAPSISPGLCGCGGCPYPKGSNIALGIFPVPSLVWPQSTPSISEHSSTSSPRRRFEFGPFPSSKPLLPPPSHAAPTASTASRPSGQNSRNLEEYLKRMQMIGEANQQQLEILQRHWDLIGGADNDLAVLKKEHMLLKHKQLSLLQEVNRSISELQERLHRETSQQTALSAQPAQPQRHRSALKAESFENESRDMRDMPFRVLIVGADGLLGRELFKKRRSSAWRSSNLVLQGISNRSNLKDQEIVTCELGFSALHSQMQSFKPHAVLHLTGTQLDELENGDFIAATSALASACDLCGVLLIHLSSDSVFDGFMGPYSVDAEPRPTTQHGQLHLEAEQLILGGH
ncbi:unnamed protein product, partial [Durusdinium trenchii]